MRVVELLRAQKEMIITPERAARMAPLGIVRGNFQCTVGPASGVNNCKKKHEKKAIVGVNQDDGEKVKVVERTNWFVANPKNQVLVSLIQAGPNLIIILSDGSFVKTKRLQLTVVIIVFQNGILSTKLITL